MKEEIIKTIKSALKNPDVIKTTKKQTFLCSEIPVVVQMVDSGIVSAEEYVSLHNCSAFFYKLKNRNQWFIKLPSPLNSYDFKIKKVFSKKKIILNNTVTRSYKNYYFSLETKGVDPVKIKTTVFNNVTEIGSGVFKTKWGKKYPYIINVNVDCVRYNLTYNGFECELTLDEVEELEKLFDESYKESRLENLKTIQKYKNNTKI